MVIYRTNEWSGYGKHSYYWNEYRQEGDSVYKVKCHREKRFNGEENEWFESESGEGSWKIDDPDMPDWLKSHICK